ncbi:MAG: hypothetical protein KGD58_19285 [Candidatus Lokiarchaeota archaeon]|nr:hypothetical protein [Candidatus Lokiarchaeota archaeon]
MASSKIFELPILENPLEITLKERANEIDFNENESKEIKELKKVHLDDIDKVRELKKWKKTLSYYSLHPEDFYFKFSDL